MMSHLSLPVVLQNSRAYVLARHGHLSTAQVHTCETARALIDTGALPVVLPPMVLGATVLLGALALAGLDLAVDCAGGHLLPKLGTWDQPVLRV